MTPYDFSLLLQPEDRSQGISEDSEIWLPARRGRITASSRAHKLITGRDSTIAAMMEEMAAELHEAPEHYSNKYTEHGHAFEDQAIGEYDMMRLTSGVIVRKPGLFVHPEIDIASATPDFFEGDDTTGQVKCPYKTANHMRLLHFGVAPTKNTEGHPQYYTQVQFESFVCRRPRIVFVSYHPDVPSTNQVYIEEMERDEKLHAKFQERLEWVHHMLVNNVRPAEEKNPPGIDGIPELF